MIESYEVIDGQHVPVTPPGDRSPTDAPPIDGSGASQTDLPGATDPPPAGAGQPSGSPPDTPSAGAGEAPADTDDEDAPLRDDSEVNAERLNRRFARLTAARRKAERERDAERQQHALELAQTRGQLDMVQRLLSGTAPTLPEPTPTGPPQPEQFASHDAYVQATARHEAQQLLAQERQQTQAQQFQQSLLAREQTFKEAHPDYDAVVRAGLAGKVAPHVQQALMLLPEGPAVAYALATQADLVQRLNTLPPPLVFAELGRLSPAPTATPPPAHGVPTPATSGSAPSSPAQQLPAPPTPLSGSSVGTPTGTFHDSMSQAEYKAWRQRTSQLPRWKER